MDTPLNVVMVQIQHELRTKIKEIRNAVPVPPYIINAVLSDIQADLAKEEIELLTTMYLSKGGQDGPTDKD